MLLSRIARKITGSNGIQSLMEDLGSALGKPKGTTSLLGGGNPARIPEVEKIYKEALLQLISSGEIESMFGEYSSPIGNDDIRNATAEYLKEHLGAEIRGENIAFFNGSQNAYSYLLNCFSGTMEDGSFKKIILPIVPEYIGYADQTWEDNVFSSVVPKVLSTGAHRFRYGLDKENLDFASAGCVVLSRPTNPTGNVLSKEETLWLYEKTKEYKIPFLLDLAYGNPFPNLIGAAEPIHWMPGMILSLSFSKVGLPGVRTGIIIADAEIISLLSSFGAVGNLAVGNLGLSLAKVFWKENTLVKTANTILRPYYEEKSKIAVQILEEAFLSQNLAYSFHEPDGGFFLWIHFPRLKITNKELYRLCKERDVYIVSGHYFFPGLTTDFSHTKQCIRLTYCRDKEEIARGAKIIAEIVARNSSET
ncbi:valine--pyruvate transaminase [Leptospira idonii]|uniref:Valine--pyruvate transaminase n=1 Tax=Leptospira idonii TaxID=1193500 RepID=A0A4R9LXK9_9LEPT|nr:valine--pyruvate transaminase [Leptospira idonii]TGN19010.1 valine--pyruvate transaminase [Leptospira idonii]